MLIFLSFPVIADERVELGYLTSSLRSDVLANKSVLPSEIRATL